MTQQQIVRSIVQDHGTNIMEMGEFFISWSGVPTLAYRGFNPVLLNIKQKIEANAPGLQPENPGSRWPKTTLGALRDDRTLSWSDVLALRRICDMFKPKFQGAPLKVHELSIVLFHCRSLERRLSTEIVPLADSTDTSVPDTDHADEVARIMDQFASARLVEYWPNLQKPGNRESHYRAPFIQATLVIDLKTVPDVIRDFRIAVDQNLPGLYCWFNDDSLHMTVRALA